MEASILTLFVQGGDIIPVPAQSEASAAPSDTRKRSAEDSANSQATAHAETTAAADAEGENGVDKEVMKLRKKLREIEKLKQRPREELDVLQQRKLEGEAELI